MMLRRWFLSSRARRKRSLAASAMHAVRFETLEQRTCMANDLDASPLRYMPLDIAASYPSNRQVAIFSSYSVNNSSTGSFAVGYSMTGLSLDEVICLIEPTYETFAYDIELCIDPSVGPRPEPGARGKLLFAAERLAADVVYFDSLAPTQLPMFNSVGDSLRDDSWNFDAGQSAGTFRPKLVDVPQTIVVDTEGEGEAENPPSITTMQKAPDSSMVLTARTAKYSEATEHKSAVREANFVAAIDWIRGSKSDELISFQATDSDEAATDQLNSQADGQAKVTAKQPASMERYGWTGLLASRGSNRAYSAMTLDNETELATDQNELRPLTAALPGLVATSEVVFEYPADTIKAYTKHGEPGRPTNNAETLPASNHQLLPVKTQGESSDAAMASVTVTEAAALPLGVFLSAEEKTETPAAVSSRSSRYWYLAAIPAFLALPRRVRDRLPSMPRLKRA